MGGWLAGSRGDSRWPMRVPKRAANTAHNLWPAALGLPAQIHMIHRLVAVFTGAALALVAWPAWRGPDAAARALLEVGDLPVQSVAVQVGYSDVSSFTRLFRHAVGLTPASYRRRFHLSSRTPGQ